MTLSADDPLQLATCQGDELAFAWAGMVAGAKVAPAEADAWRARFARAGGEGSLQG